MRFVWGILAPVAVTSSLFIATASAHTLSWSAPLSVAETGSPDVSGMSCPSASQCTAIDDSGREVTFVPGEPAAPAPVVIDNGLGLRDVSCPSITQCTAITSTGADGIADALTFNPQSPAAVATTPIHTGGFLDQIACPATNQCSVVLQEWGCDSYEVTFDPSSPGFQTEVPIDEFTSGCPVGHFSFGPLLALACPSASRCVAVEGNGSGEITFDPRSPGSPTPVTIDAGGWLQAVACPTVSLCVATDDGGHEVTFDPGAPAANTSAAVDDSALDHVDCPSTQQCTAVDTGGQAVTFAPAAPGHPEPHPVATATPSGLACPTTSQCSVVQDTGLEVSFDPYAGRASLLSIDRGGPLQAVSCPATTRCTAVGSYGETTFRPVAPPEPSSVGLGLFPWAGVSCPAASLCVAFTREGEGNVSAFDPANPADASLPWPITSSAMSGLVCPSTTLCVAVSGQSEVTFDPTALAGLSGPTQATPHPVDVAGPTLTAVACPTVSSCTAVDTEGGEVIFDPRSPGTFSRSVLEPAPGASGILALACPSASTCVAVDGAGNEVTFGRHRPTRPRVRRIDTRGHIEGLACGAPTLCIAVDDAGRAIQGDPTSNIRWTPTTVTSGALLGIGCAAAWQCVAVDTVGDAFVGTQPHPKPRLTRVRESHRRWREPGHRSGTPASPLGTEFDFVLNERARVTFTFVRHVRQRHVVVAGTWTVTGHKGRNRVRFAGRLSRRRVLGLGPFAVRIVAVSPVGVPSRAHSLAFAIVG